MKRAAACLFAVFPVLLLAASGCGGDDAEVRSAAPVDGDTRYRGSITVLEDQEHGPQLCGAMTADATTADADATAAESDVPSCGGPDIVGWDWDDVADERSANGVTWGDYEVTGTWDGERLTLTEPPGPPVWGSGDPEPSDFAPSEPSGPSTPCPEPDGGWPPAGTTDAYYEAQEATYAAAEARPDFAGAWIDQTFDPEADPPSEIPATEVVNIAVTGDIDAAEADLRAIWDGALCVSEAEHTLTELEEIQEEIVADFDANNVASGIDHMHNQVTAGVIVEAGAQAELDDRYGKGLVVVEATLVPVQ